MCEAGVIKLCEPIVRVHLTSAGLGATGSLRHDDLVNPEDGQHGIRGELHGPRLGVQGVKYFHVHSTLGRRLLDVDAVVDVARLMRGKEGCQRLRGIQAAVLGQRAGHHLQCSRKLLDGVLIEPLRGLAKFVQSSGKLQLARASAGKEAVVPDHALKHVDGIINTTLEVVQNVFRAATQKEGGDATAAATADGAEHAHLGAGQLIHRHLVTDAQLLGSGCTRAHKRNGAARAAHAAQLELGGHLHHHDLVPLEEVQGQLADCGAAHEHVHAHRRKVFDNLLHGFFLRLGVREQVLRALQQHGALGLGLGAVKAGSQHGKLCVLDVLDGAFRVARDGKAGDQDGV
mmetsp:Transcript_29453/g.74123  ORF Transcript_29453/g.74123 Transcript_29453/m.74123 type:complete len:344 (+) Transcript_29453:40-1071(+)